MSMSKTVEYDPINLRPMYNIIIGAAQHAKL